MLAASVSAILVSGLFACASSQTATGVTQSAAPATPQLCKTGEPVAFTCELRDGRLVSLCASPGFEKFQGSPKDNPGYAYLTLGTSSGQVQQSFPTRTQDFRRYMHTGVTIAGAPYLAVATEKGPFFYISGRTDIPVSSTPANQPADWSLPANGDQSLCVKRGQQNLFDAVLAQLPNRPK